MVPLHARTAMSTQLDPDMVLNGPTGSRETRDPSSSQLEVCSYVFTTAAQLHLELLKMQYL